MELNSDEINLLNNYIPTLKRYLKKKISYKYFKDPFIENYILKLITIYKDEKLISKIIDKINESIISNEDILFSIKYYYNLNKNEYLKVQNFLYEQNEDNDTLIIKFSTNIILFNIKYYQYYFIINELLFDENELNQLFYAIYLFIKIDKDNLLKYCKKYFKMRIFFYLMYDLFNIYKKNIDLLLKNDIISNYDAFKNFIQNLFFKWHLNYKESIENNNFEEIEKKFIIKKNIFQKIICTHNLC